ncbi:MAG: Flp pilus assembly protein CpaB [Pseudomonadota bacterium]
MRAIALFVLVAGMVLAGGAAYYVFAQVRAAEMRLANGREGAIPLIEVAIATQHLKYGQPLTQENVRMVAWPAEAAPENGFTSLQDLFGRDGARRVVLRRMEPNEPVLTSKVTGFGEKATVAALLDPGMRAHTLKVDAVSSVGGFLLPGTRIDLFYTVEDRRKIATTRLLMQNLEIIAVDQDTDPDRIEARVAKTVTVQATPEQVHALTLAGRIGSFNIALRGFGSQEVAELAPMTRNQLLGVVEEVVEPEPEPEPEPSTVRVRRGGEVEIRTLD